MDDINFILNEVDRIFFSTVVPEIDLQIEHIDLSITTTECVKKQTKFPRLNTGPNHIHIDKVINEISQIIDADIFNLIFTGVSDISIDDYIIKKWQLSVALIDGKIEPVAEDKKTLAFNDMHFKFDFIKLFYTKLLTSNKKGKIIIIRKIERAIAEYNTRVNDLRKYGIVYYKIPMINTKPTKFTGKVKNNLQAGIDSVEDGAKDREIKLVHYYLTGTNYDIDHNTISVIIGSTANTVETGSSLTAIINKSKFILNFLSIVFDKKIRSIITNMYMDLLRLDFSSNISPNILSPTISLCSHKSNRSSHLCWASTVENLISFLDVHIFDPEIWTCNLINLEKIPTDTSKSSHLINFLQIKCPMIKTTHCGTNIDNKQCLKPIPLRKILSYLPLEKRKYYQKLVPKLYKNICKLHYPQLFFYCVNSQCEYASNGFIYNEYSHGFHTMENTHTTCKKCNVVHYVHQHRIVCIGCQTTFCNTCKQTPYHEKELCLGPDIDVEKLSILKETGAKLCPNCSEAVIKQDGCDHIKCACKIDWCFRCNKILNSTNVYSHTCIPSDFLNGNVSFAYH